MPLLRYFLYVGGALLALLLVANAALPPLPAGDGITSSSELPVIRIHSDRKRPEAIVFDTSMPTMASPVVAKVRTAAPAPLAAAEFPPKARVREAFAQFVPPETQAAASAKPKKVEAKAETRLHPKRRVARAHANRPLMLVAQQPQPQRFGLFTW